MWERYNQILSKTQGEKLSISSLRFVPIIVSYLASILGNYYFSSSRLGKESDLMNTLSLSIPFDICTFATFDLNATVIFRHWDLRTCILDTFFQLSLIALLLILGILQQYLINIKKNEYKTMRTNKKLRIY